MNNWVPIKSQTCRYCNAPMEVRSVYMGCEHIPVLKYRHKETKSACCFAKFSAEPRNHDKVRAEFMEAETPKAISANNLYEQFAKRPLVK